MIVRFELLRTFDFHVHVCVIRVAKYIPLKYFQNISPQYFSRQVPPQLSRAPAREEFLFLAPQAIFFDTVFFTIRQLSAR